MSADKVARSINLSAVQKFSPDSRVNQEILATASLMVRMNCYEPGQVTPMHLHPNEDEILYIVSGSGTITFKESDDLPVTAGELVCLPADQFHQIVAGPDDRLVLIYFMTPEYSSVRPDDKAVSDVVKRLPGEKG